jgi:NAD(P)-dependent dehydrogenase (short-subunit alcohol dehydrogenase family)
MIGSWAAARPHPHVPAYSVAKAGLRMLTRCLAAELAPHQILVNEVAIGVVDAGVSRTTFAEQPQLRARSEAQVPLGHLVEVDEIVAEVLALCDPRRRSMTGSTILLDGGISLRTALSGQEQARG